MSSPPEGKTSTKLLHFFGLCEVVRGITPKNGAFSPENGGEMKKNAGKTKKNAPGLGQFKEMCFLCNRKRGTTDASNEHQTSEVVKRCVSSAG